MKFTIALTALLLFSFSCPSRITQPTDNDGTFTAADRLSSVVAYVQAIYPDAQLLRVSSSFVDTTGKALQWNYWFIDPSGPQPLHYFHATTSQITYDSSSQLPVGPGAITSYWFDSDSAFIFAQRYVGSQYCTANPEFSVTASLGQSMTPDAHAVWTVLYHSSTMITNGIFIDGSTGALIGQTR